MKRAIFTVLVGVLLGSFALADSMFDTYTERNFSVLYHTDCVSEGEQPANPLRSMSRLTYASINEDDEPNGMFEPYDFSYVGKVACDYEEKAAEVPRESVTTEIKTVSVPVKFRYLVNVYFQRKSLDKNHFMEE